MANVDFPRGFWPIRHLTGGEIRTVRYTVTLSATIYRGDLLKAVGATGTVEVAAAGDDTAIIGVAANYVVAPASGITSVEVWDDPNIVFGCQVVTGETPVVGDVFGGSNIVTYLAGNTSTFVSKLELDTIGTGAKQVKILGLIDDPANSWAEHANVECLINEHFYHGSRPDTI